MSVQDMLLGSTSSSSHPDFATAAAGPWQDRHHPDVHHLLSSRAAGQDDVEDMASMLDQDQDDERTDQSQHRQQFSSRSTIITTPGGNVAYRDPVSGEIAWVAQGSFATPVAFALDATTGATLDVDIVPDAVLPHGSNEYLSRELQRQLDRQQQQYQGNDSDDTGL